MNKNDCALTPPMGWNSWDCYGADVTEEQLLQNALRMQELLLPHGWQYVVCDIQWAAPPVPGKVGTYHPFVPLTLDKYGRQQPEPTRFPSAANGKGFADIARKIHDMGLKFGIHIMRGIPRHAVHARLPVLGTEATADQIADPFSLSRWNGDMYGVLDTPQGQAYYDSLFAQYAAWGVDYVKVDDICNTNMYPLRPYSARHEVEMIARAIRRSGRPMVLSLSPGPAVIEEAWHLQQHANMWRITDDFWDEWRLLKEMFWRCEVWHGHGKPGCWPDCDMLPLGKIGVGFGNARQTNFTREEQRTLMTLWCVFRSPLMMGGALTELDDWTLSLLVNDEALRLLREGRDVRQLFRTEDAAAWTSTDAQGDHYLALFNLSDEERTGAALDWLDQTPAETKELWGRDNLLQGHESALLPSHGAALIRCR